MKTVRELMMQLAELNPDLPVRIIQHDEDGDFTVHQTSQVVVYPGEPYANIYIEPMDESTIPWDTTKHLLASDRNRERLLRAIEELGNDDN